MPERTRLTLSEVLSAPSNGRAGRSEPELAATIREDYRKRSARLTEDELVAAHGAAGRFTECACGVIVVLFDGEDPGLVVAAHGASATHTLWRAGLIETAR